jgi:hypothetical protein
MDAGRRALNFDDHMRVASLTGFGADLNAQWGDQPLERWGE